LAVVKALLEHSATDPNIAMTTAECETPLFAAAMLGHTPMIELLIAHNADVNQLMANGLTPLMGAAHNGQRECASRLLAAGADRDAKMTGSDNSFEAGAGTTALDLARMKGHASVVALLEQQPAEEAEKQQATEEEAEEQQAAKEAEEQQAAEGAEEEGNQDEAESVHKVGVDVLGHR
jgi:ankyrin repeat protein